MFNLIGYGKFGYVAENQLTALDAVVIMLWMCHLKNCFLRRISKAIKLLSPIQRMERTLALALRLLLTVWKVVLSSHTFSQRTASLNAILANL